MATNLANQLPTISRNGMRVLLPHTKASFKIQDVIPKNHLMDFKLTEDEMKLIQLDEFVGNNESNEKRTEQKLGLLSRSIGANRKNLQNQSEIIKDAQPLYSRKGHLHLIIEKHVASSSVFHCFALKMIIDINTTQEVDM
ncbi:unnamed protein product [Onchocerca flexuosa]|uniref:Uncharacterized protein n=1 Tax=Onchocerca flexuosa TaxID=387005 RepID=A0A183GXS1_9BILA|nr:unnamed protein product [Onchocerca flexuosa]